MQDMNKDIEQVRQVLQRFQDGYTERDVQALDAFMEMFVEQDELEVIGTGAVGTGTFEWCTGLEQTRELVKNDWEGWGDLRLDVPSARIYTLGEVAWLASTATVSMTLAEEEEYQNFWEYIERLLKQENRSQKERVLEIVRNGTNIQYEMNKGELFIWPLRFTAVLVRREGRWLFHQMQFSFPTTNFPDVRLAPGA